MTDYAKHDELYAFDIVIGGAVTGTVSLTYPQVMRLGKLLASMRTDGVGGEQTLIRASKTDALSVTRVEVKE